jgi:hypothetical protein
MKRSQHGFKEIPTQAEKPGATSHADEVEGVGKG